ncbi:TPA: hypothetical protein IX413_002530 [Enterococcus faecium]|nr:hypothetical protein [Enterococcus faecium]
MEWLKNEKELFQFLSDMKRKNQVANLDNYIKWIKDQSVPIYQNSESDNLNIRISVSDKQKNVLIY